MNKPTSKNPLGTASTKPPSRKGTSTGVALGVSFPPAGAPGRAKPAPGVRQPAPGTPGDGSRSHQISRERSPITPPSRESKLITSGEGVSQEIKDLVTSGKLEKSPVTDLSKVVCDLCRSPYREDIEFRHQSGEPLSRISQLFGVPEALITKHMTHKEVSARLEATSDSVTSDILKWRSRIERLYSRLESMMDTIESGLILQGFDNDTGEPILSPAAIKDIKPAADSMTKLMTEARQTIELFGRVNKLFQHERDSTGGAITFVQIGIPALNTSDKPVTLDAKVTTVDDAGHKAIQIAGNRHQLPEYRGEELGFSKEVLMGKIKEAISGGGGAGNFTLMDKAESFLEVLDKTPVAGVVNKGEVKD